MFNALRSTKYTSYPILVKILEFPEKIFCAGIYCSNKFESKSMPHPDIILKQFLEDINILCTNGIDSNEQVIPCTLAGFICDAPVRAVLKNIQFHSGYNSCERCVQHGRSKERTIVLPRSRCEPRTDESFRDRTDAKHHKSLDLNLLESMEFPMVSGFILDEMHLCFLGVTKRILNRLLNLKIKQKKVRMSMRARKSLKKKLRKFQMYVPSEFCRKLEGDISTILKWKASQYRLFLLYVGIVIFRYKKIVPSELYNNFLNFSIALRLLNTENQENNLPFIKKLLLKFVKDAKKIYGPSFACYNVHCATHLCEDYRNFGMLNKISAFGFESYLGANIKGAVRAGFKPLNQIGEHVSKLNCKYYVPKILNSMSSIKKKTCNHDLHGKCYKKICQNNMILKPNNISERDSYILLKNGSIGTVTAIHVNELNDILLQIDCYNTIEDLFDDPIPSSQVGIYKIKILNRIKTVTAPLSDVISKLFVLPYKTHSLIAMTLLHLSE